MKKRILLAIGAATVAAIALNVNASNALLSPRAAGNQIKTTSTMVANHNNATENQSVMVSPRVSGNQTAMGAGMAKDTNLAVQCARTMAGCTASANMQECPMTRQTGCMMR